MGKTIAVLCAGCGFNGEAMEGTGLISGPLSFYVAICEKCRCFYDLGTISNIPPVHNVCGKQGRWLRDTAVIPPELEKLCAEDAALEERLQQLRASGADTSENPYYDFHFVRIGAAKRDAFREVLRKFLPEDGMRLFEPEKITVQGAWVYDRLDPCFYLCPDCGQSKLLAWQTDYLDLD